MDSRRSSLRCQTCDKQFSLYHALAKHKTTCAPCPVCGRVFQRISDQNRHRRRCLRHVVSPDDNDSATPALPEKKQRSGNESVDVLNGYLTPQESLAICGPNVAKGIDDRDRPFVVAESDRSERKGGEEEELNDVVRSNWKSIKSFYKCHKIVDILNVRVWDPEDDTFSSDPVNALVSTWNSGRWKTKINASIGCILQHKETGQFRYFHSSSNNSTLFEQPVVVGSKQQLHSLTEKLSEMDVSETAIRQRPNTQWRLFSVTNMTFYLYKMPGVGRVGGSSSPGEPRQAHVVGLYKNKKTGRSYSDNLCFFRCLAMLMDCNCVKGKCRCTHPRERTVKNLFRKYLENGGHSPDNFPGIDETELSMLERVFGICITVFRLNADGKTSVIWNSGKHSSTRLNVKLSGNHFSYIKNVNAFCRSFSCDVCEAVFTRASSCRRHKCKVGNITELVCVGGLFAQSESLLDEVKRVTGIHPDRELYFHPYRATFDIEAMLPADSLPPATDTMTFENEHRLLSISVCSNVPKYKEPVCFVVGDDGASGCVRRFVDYLHVISEESFSLMKLRYRNLLTRITEVTDLQELREQGFSDVKLSNRHTYKSRAHLSDLTGRLEGFMGTLPVVGFNSQRYDLNVMKGALMKELFGEGCENSRGSFIVKRQDALTCVQTTALRFVDVVNFMCPGFSYSNYLKAYGVREQKGFFPYEWLDSLEKLDQTTIPTRQDFYSKLRRETISEEDYDTVVQVWKDKNMKTVRDLLIWYNNLDVKPFLEALEKQSEIYRQKNIDMLTRAISLPGLAVLWMFETIGPRETLRCAYAEEIDNGVHSVKALEKAVISTRRLHLIDETNEDLYQLFRDNLVGGPSLVFHRYHEAGVTPIRPADHGEKLCQQILGVDANALYLFCLMQDMPVGRPRRRMEEDCFRIKKTTTFGRMAQGWLAWYEFQTNKIIETALCEGERRLGRHNLPVDGFCQETHTVYQFNGCYWHGHRCSEATSKPIGDRSAEQRYSDTVVKKEYLKNLGYNVVDIWECEWRSRVATEANIKQFLKVFYKHTYGQDCKMTTAEVLKRVSDGSLFGFIECDIRVPEHLTDKFAEMPPIFKNVKLDRSHLSDHMREFAESEGYLRSPQRYLIGSMFGEKILLLSELLRWYLEQGLVVDRVYQIIEFERAPILKPFGESVTAARRAGDTDTAQKLLANTAKLIGNSLYGKTIVDKTKHRNVSYTTDENKASRSIANRRFHSVNILDEEVYETVLFKKRVRLDVCIFVGLSILQYSKLHMNRYHYECLDRYVSRCDYQMINMDTDSSYVALSGPLTEIIRPQMLEDFLENYDKWYVQPYCPHHKAQFKDSVRRGEPWNGLRCCRDYQTWDSRTPGKFKVEFQGTVICALNAKTYICQNRNDTNSPANTKLSSKGLSKRTNNLTVDNYKKVLFSKAPVQGLNTGFIRKNNQTFTYSQIKTGLTYFYGKRQVLDDGVSTTFVNA